MSFGGCDTSLGASPLGGASHPRCRAAAVLLPGVRHDLIDHRTGHTGAFHSYPILILYTCPAPWGCRVRLSPYAVCRIYYRYAGWTMPHQLLDDQTCELLDDKT
eukprot:7296520-Prymnesium_polylepis.1